MTFPLQTYFPAPASTQSFISTAIYDTTFMYMIAILVYTTYAFIYCTMPGPHTNTTSTLVIETIFTVAPTLIVIAIFVPSIKALYFMNTIFDQSYPVKITAHQWSWDFSTNPSSLPVDVANTMGPFYSLETTSSLAIPVSTPTTFYVTSSDVIHSFVIPDMSIKIDAIPGSINSISVYPLVPGTYHGMCQELCGASHSAMPFTLKVI